MVDTRTVYEMKRASPETLVDQPVAVGLGARVWYVRNVNGVLPTIFSMYVGMLPPPAFFGCDFGESISEEHLLVHRGR